MVANESWSLKRGGRKGRFDCISKFTKVFHIHIILIFVDFHFTLVKRLFHEKKKRNFKRSCSKPVEGIGWFISFVERCTPRFNQTFSSISFPEVAILLVSYELTGLPVCTSCIPYYCEVSTGLPASQF